MLRGLYTASTGLASILFRNEIEINNLTNAKTVGYKKEEVVFKSFKDSLNRAVNYENPSASSGKSIGKIGSGVMVDDVITYWNMQGELLATGRDLDLAVLGKGYLVLENDQGERYYTRNGSFDLDNRAQLTNDDGYTIMGQKGPIKLKGQLIDILDEGKIYVDGEYVDTLEIVDIEEPEKIGGNIYKTSKPELEADGKIKQGYLEQSNTSPIEGMTKYLKNLRAYESNQKVVQAYDATLDKLINEVGRV